MSEPGWQVHSREPLCETPHLAVYRERVTTPHQSAPVEWLTVDRKVGVVIVPRRTDGSWLLIHEDRISPRRSFWSFPAGQVDDPSPQGLATAQSELTEETGHLARGEWHYLGPMFTSPGFTNEHVHLWLADAVEPMTEPLSREAAIRDIRAFSSEELAAAVREGTVCDANTLSALTQLAVRGLF